MTIEQKIFLKLEPHAKRIKDGEGNDFDYLPAVLLQLMEEQNRHAQFLEEIRILLNTNHNAAIDAYIVGYSSTTQSVIDECARLKIGFTLLRGHIQEVILDRHEKLLMEIQSTQGIVGKAGVEFTRANSLHATQIIKRLDTIDSQITSFVEETKKSSAKSTRFFIAALVGIVATIGLAFAILLRH